MHVEALLRNPSDDRSPTRDGRVQSDSPQLQARAPDEQPVQSDGEQHAAPDEAPAEVTAAVAPGRKRRVPWNKTEHPDGFDWTKYGQKTLKGSGVSTLRQYYRCSFVGCPAKKTVGVTDSLTRQPLTVCDPPCLCRAAKCR